MAEQHGDIRPYASQQDVIELVRSLYGMKALAIKQLNGYDDQNFHVKVNLEFNDNENVKSLCKLGYVFKVLNTESSSQDKDHLAGQLGMLNHVIDRGIVCPRHVPDKRGQLFSEQNLPDKSRTGTSTHVVRMLEYIDGEILATVNMSPELAYKGGVYLSRLHHALQGFDDERLRRDDFLWSLNNVHKLRDYLKHVKDDGDRALVEQVLDKWDSVQKLFSKLPQVPIHSDFNEQNILVRQSDSGEVAIAGILDFQDSGYGLAVYDIAIYIMYMMTLHADDPVEIGGYCLQGFRESYPLNQTEYDILYFCVIARLIQSLVLGAYSFSLHKDPYHLLTQIPGWKVLKDLWSRPSKAVIEYWLSDKFRN